MKIGNAFSANMLSLEDMPVNVMFSKTDAETVKNIDVLESCIGHADTAAVVSNVLGRKIDANRTNVSLKKGDSMIVVQYIGPRLAEGAIKLPEGARIEFLFAKLED